MTIRNRFLKKFEAAEMFCEGLFSIILKLIGCHLEALLPPTQDYKYAYGL